MDFLLIYGVMKTSIQLSLCKKLWLYYVCKIEREFLSPTLSHVQMRKFLD